MQRKCGTCKFFEEGGIASSGWCKHPDRQDLEHMVLVRKTELACRDGWDHDLWEPREGGGTGGAGSATRSNGRPASRRPASGGRISSAKSSTDAVIDRNGMSEKHLADGGATTVSDQPLASDHSSSQHSNGNGQDIHAHSSDLASDGVDELQDETIVYHSPARRDDWQAQLESYRERERTQFEPVPRPSVLDENDLPLPEHPGEPTDQSPNGSGHGNGPQNLAPVRQSGVTEQFEVEPQVPEPQTFGVSEADEEISTGDESADNEDETNAPVHLPMLQASNATCRNCRDFLPAKNGRGGWCDNPFAFEERQAVSGGTVACQGSFGSWWSPSDDWWMERADIAHHSAPTPLIDNLIRQLRSRQFEDEGSTEGQHRS